MGFMEFIASLGAPVLASVLVIVGNYILQQKIDRRRRDAHELKERYYKLLGLASRYWTSDSRSTELEAQISSMQLIISSECNQVKGYSRKLGSWYSESVDSRLDLMDTVSGGCFQQVEWHPAPERVSKAGLEISRIIGSLSKQI